MKTVILDWSTVTSDDISSDCFAEFGKIISYPLTPSELTVERIGDAEAILCNKTLITADEIGRAHV